MIEFSSQGGGYLSMSPTKTKQVDQGASSPTHGGTAQKTFFEKLD
jgi:hypothetical protein